MMGDDRDELPCQCQKYINTLLKAIIHFNTLCTNVDVVIIVMFMNCNQITCADMI